MPKKIFLNSIICDKYALCYDNKAEVANKVFCHGFFCQLCNVLACFPLHYSRENFLIHAYTVEVRLLSRTPKQRKSTAALS